MTWCPSCRVDHSQGVSHPHPIVRAEMQNKARLLMLGERPMLCFFPGCSARWLWYWNRDAGRCFAGHEMDGLLIMQLQQKGIVT